MAITSVDSYIASSKQKIRFQKASATSVAAQWHTLFNLAGTPGAGSFYNINVVNGSTNGRVCDNTIPGFPTINPFGAGNTGYLTGFDFSNSVAGRFMLYDRVWEAGNFVMAGTIRSIPLTTDASLYSYRIPTTSAGNKDWSTLGIWVDVSTTLSASASTLAFGYINELGEAKTTPPTGSLSGFISGRTFQMPLAAGDKGVQRITDISIGGATNAAGVFNVYLARTLYTGARVNVANFSDVHGFEKLAMPVIDASMCLGLNFAADSTATGVVDCIIEIANG